MLAQIARLATAHPRRTLMAVALVVLAAAAYGSGATNALNARNDFEDPGSQSAHARTLLEHATGTEAAPGVLVLVRAPVASPEIGRVATALTADREVARVTPPQGSVDGRSTLLAASLRAGDEPHAAVDGVESALRGQPGVKLGGAVVAGRQVGKQASADLGLAEALAFPLLALLAALIFRGVAALLPVAVGGSSVFAAFAALRAVSAALPLSVFALNLVIGLGLGLAVDYSLFMVSRFREEMGAGADPPAAVAATLATAGRTVVYSAVTVAIAMASLTVFPLRFLQSMGIGGAIVAVIAAAVALTLMPALFIVLGTRLGKVVPAAPREGRWYRLAHAVLRRPGVVALATIAALVALALPALGTRWTGVDASVLPTSRSARVVEDALRHDFRGLTATPAVVAAQAGPGHASDVAGLAARMRSVGGVEAVAAPVYRGHDVWQIDATLRGDSIDTRAQAAVRSIRALPAPFAFSLGGTAAQFYDQRAAIAASLPLGLGILALGTLLVLWLMTGSVVLPIKALAMNVLTVGAATGLLVTVFQHGRLEGLLGYTSQGGIEQSDYLVLAAIAFALSTDYGVFLLTRIKEAHDRGEPTGEAVALGLERTGRIVTAAALLLAVAIGAFATSQVVFLKEIGVGAVAAVLLDAFVIRSLLVPALMGLLGSWNWWSPPPLRRLHERLGLDEAGAPAAARAGAA